MKMLFPRYMNSALQTGDGHVPAHCPAAEPGWGGRACGPEDSQDEHGHGHHDTEQDEEGPENQEDLSGQAVYTLLGDVAMLAL